ncbi:Homocysteine S-methyltransferase [Coniella lustricola]|uniref:Homocysteine S-methyltransferase n=1 Tax=Coniella lustricola TaxID=2025994 RepID=A0A2T3A751_9PEZI|nr:Homocysteine S-methyltransferase [Coniella lustricola]
MANDTPILFLDGGLGTSLEDKYNYKFSNKTTPLWSSHPLVGDPQTLLACQSDFGRVPVDVIETATYQVSVHGFAATKTEQWPGGVDRASIPRFLDDAVDIAEQACGKPGAQVALSLGPYGSTMVPGQEYSGAYDEDHNDEQALLRWWSDRVSLFSKESIAKVSYVACETLPRLDEIHAVRRMMAEFTTKPFWIACVFPGEAPELPDGSSIQQTVQAMLTPAAGKGQPWGIGINCTKLHKLERLVACFEHAVATLLDAGLISSWPALVLYPDGTNGEVYNTTTQQWELPAGHETPRISWEKHLGDLVLQIAQRRKWSTILVGGCCKASHSDLQKLIEHVRRV